MVFCHFRSVTDQLIYSLVVFCACGFRCMNLTGLMPFFQRSLNGQAWVEDGHLPIFFCMPICQACAVGHFQRGELYFSGEFFCC